MQNWLTVIIVEQKGCVYIVGCNLWNMVPG